EEGKKAKRSDEYARLSAEIQQVLSRQGHVLIPAFGLGRAQEIMTMLARMKQDGGIDPDVPVLVHKGVTEAVTAVYDRHAPDVAGGGPLVDSVRFISGFKRDNSFKTAEEMAGQPGIFVFSSGMMIRGTPSARLAAELVTSENNGIFFPGYAAPGQLGYELLNTEIGGSICIDRHDNTWVDVRCANIKKFTFSAHASAEDLIAVARQLAPSCVVWVHGEETSVTRLQNMTGEKLSALSPVNRETLLLRMAGKKINRSFRTYRGILVTVGTSLIYTCLSKKGRPISAAGQVTREELQEFILENLTDLPGLCAETNSLSKQQIGENDFIYFISGNSGPGRLCGETLAGLYGSSHLCQFVPIDGLEPRADLFEEKGMGNLIEALSFLIERHAGNSIILATGGFKAQIALATELGILFRQKVYYLYEDFKAAVQLPELPVDFDYTAIAAHQDAFFQLLDAREYWLAESTYKTLPSTLRLCFQKDDLQRRYTLTSLGRAIIRGFKGKQIDDIPIEVDDNSMLWGSQRKTYRQMINPDIIVILDRISKNRHLITGLEFSTSMTLEIEHREENCLELVKHQDAQLVYVIHRLKGATKRTEMLTINTLPGMASTLLGQIGKRIYP
ncbi:MAG: hypothetical protein K9K87_13380, partial [Desulfotignum sp.]|nr:hypothetical protein [Desulfotignum sp.]